jgi:hypothetical protein
MGWSPFIVPPLYWTRLAVVNRATFSVAVTVKLLAAPNV